MGSDGRCTPAERTVRRRPRWHRALGWTGVAAGLVVIMLNDLMLLDPTVTLLPFGHAEFYLLLGLSVAGGSSWYLGVFDRGPTVYE